MTIVNDNSRVVNKLVASLIDDARVVIYDRQMFIVQATAQDKSNLYLIFTFYKSFNWKLNIIYYTKKVFINTG
jgi:hypothetical protein